MPETSGGIEDEFFNIDGMKLSMFDESFVNHTLQQRIDVTGCTDIKGYRRFVAENSHEAELFKELLQVSYSLFFRNTFTFAVLENIVLPQILNSRGHKKNREIRIWSAACAGGQEPYSLAILLQSLIRPEENISYRIFGTDRNDCQIEIAKTGQYSKESMANIRQCHLDQWFTRTGNTYAIADRLKNHCEFYIFNLLSDLNSPPESIYGDFDLVLCANILFYYKPMYQKIILDKITESLAADGLLVTGEAEREIVIRGGRFREVYPHSAIFRRK